MGLPNWTRITGISLILVFRLLALTAANRRWTQCFPQKAKESDTSWPTSRPVFDRILKNSAQNYYVLVAFDRALTAIVLRP
jgi:hypothetical protein